MKKNLKKPFETVKKEKKNQHNSTKTKEKTQRNEALFDSPP